MLNINVIFYREEEEKANSDDRNQVKFNVNSDKNEILVIKKRDDKKATSISPERAPIEVYSGSKLSSKKNLEEFNEYKQIINEIDENQEQENEEELKINRETPGMKDNSKQISNNHSIERESMEINGYALTDPFESNLNKRFLKYNFIKSILHTYC